MPTRLVQAHASAADTEEVDQWAKTELASELLEAISHSLADGNRVQRQGRNCLWLSRL
jgi:hypothetical protein